MSDEQEVQEPFPDLDAAGALRAAFRARERSAADSARANEAVRFAPRAPQRYELHTEIARGGMGVILEAFDRELTRDVALKVLRDELACEPRCLERFLAEARVTARLDHPGIVPVHEAGWDPAGRAYFAMRLVRGRDLLRILDLAKESQEGWSQTRCLSVILKVCEAMAYAHGKGVIHRDLKPSNVMVGEFGEVYVMDWGLARVIGQDDAHDLRLRERGTAEPASIESQIVTMDGEVLGTPCYMSPEQAQGRVAELEPRSDVYSVGAMLYHLLAGAMPYVPPGTRASSDEVLRRLLEGPPRPLHELQRDLPPELIAISERAMARAPSERYRSMLAMAEDLRAFLERRVVSAYETGAWAEAKKWVRRNKGLAAASAAAVLALASGLIASLVLRAQSEHNAELARDNAAAAQQSERQAQREKERAEGSERLATERADDVLRLSALQDLDDLSAQADRLWPAQPEMVGRYEEWLARAQQLVDELPGHEAKLSDLRARALPWSAEQEAERRANHEQLSALEKAERSLAYLRTLQAVRDAPQEARDPSPEEVGVDPAALPDVATELDRLARPLVYRQRSDHGGEAKGLFLARRALELAATLPPSERAPIRDTLAWALFANGRLDEALVEEQRALEEAGAERGPELERSLERLRASIEEQLSPEGLRQEEQRVAQLEARVAELAAEIAQRPELAFADTQDRWWHNQLEKLVDGLMAFGDPETGLFSSGVSPEHGWGVGKRLEFARTIAERSVNRPEAAARWSEALASIRDEAECPAYDGLALAPQLGLFPIGRDPASGLWEFAHLQTGEPARRGADGKLVLRDETGLVFVLLPGGVFRMGAQRRDPDGPNFDPGALENEGPVHEETVLPFFLSKYEMTQGQWERFTGTNPSLHGPRDYSKGWSRDHRAWSWLHPVEKVSWGDCTGTLARASLVLPTEAQWEYACRAGTSSPYWTGDEPESLRGAANLSDSYSKHNGHSSWQFWEPWLDDGETLHAEVGSYRANAFGLHDVHGNLDEWCEDRAGGQYSLLRGGSFGGLAANARSSFRYLVGSGSFAIDIFGLRPAREISP